MTDTNHSELERKIKLPKIIENAKKEMIEIEGSNKPQSVKTKEFQRLAEKIQNQIYTDERRRDSLKIAPSTYKTYLTTVRNALKATGLTHHSLQGTRRNKGTLAYVMDKYPRYADMLEGLRNEHAQTIGALRNEILKKVRADKSNPKRRRAYADIKAMKIDHEVLRNLWLDVMVKAELTEQEHIALEKKKTSVVRLHIDDINAIISAGLASDSYSRQAFALALTCGRRAIEILYTGSFEVNGKNTVMFSGQAKKQRGIDSKTYEIYTLIPADEFVEAFEKFRKLPPLVALRSDFSELDKEQRNKEINARTAKTLNNAAKYAMGDKSRVFKDSRTIYASICLDTFHKTDERWRESDADVFVKHILGHGAVSTLNASAGSVSGSDFGATMNYKQFVIEYGERSVKSKPDTSTEESNSDTVKKKPTASEINKAQIPNELKPAAEILSAEENSDTLNNYHKKVAYWLNNNPKKRISYTALYKNVGGNKNTVKQYIALIQPFADAYNANL